VLAGINTEGRVENTRREGEPKAGRGLRVRKKEAEDKTGK
jgi:hypothetical protein